MCTRIYLSALAVMIGTAPLQAADQNILVTEADYARVNTHLIASHVIPRYEVLVQATSQLVQISQSFCSETDATELSAIRNQFHQTMDAWFGVAHIRFGPIEFLMRQHRFFFWPQARGKVVAAVTAAIASGDSIVMIDHNVAAQGLLAIEAMLFHAQFFGGNEANKSQVCTWLIAVVRNLESMAVGTLADWRDGDSAYAQFMQQPDVNNPFYERHEAATLHFFQSLFTSLQFVYDINLKPVVGDTLATARPVLAESRPSARSTRNLTVTLLALQELYGSDDRIGLSDLTSRAEPKLDTLMQKAFRVTLTNLKALSVPIEVAATDADKRLQLEKLTKQIQAIKQIVRSRLSKAIGLTVGFNALDGD